MTSAQYRNKESKRSPYWGYWGKAQPRDEGGQGHHPLVFHSLDVAAVGQALLRRHQPLRSFLSRASGLTEEEVITLVTWLLMLHDAGKFSDAFQGLVPELAETLRGEDIEERPYAVRHDSMGQVMLYQALEDLFADGELAALVGGPDLVADLVPWLRAVTGHHGKPPQEAGYASMFASHCNTLALEAFILDATRLMIPHTLSLEALNEERITASSWQLAGLCVVADWVGSSQYYFPYQAPDSETQEGLAEYWQKARKKAHRAIVSTQVFPSKLSGCAGMSALYPDFASTPSPLQALTDRVPIPATPQLFIVEDIAGAGKTEATMVLVSRLLQEGVNSGLYFALPTMATANGLRPRIEAVYKKLFDPKSRPSFVLAHGAAHLQDRLAARDSAIAGANELPYSEGEETASAHCSRWIADSRKRSLLADIGVGTIDQALLAALPVKHGSLRQLGLLNKVLVVDEVHAYDDYMTGLLARLIRLHASTGGSCVLLSATMPLSLRQQLCDAFSHGLGRSDTHALTASEFPLLTQVNAQSATETPCQPREATVRAVGVNYLHSKDTAIDRLLGWAQAGKCCLWIRNTVADAIEAYDVLRAQWPETTLFHARFCLGDRIRIEKDVLSRFGPNSGETQRAGQIVVATQVVEQSLDLDFDEMVSDLCPIDLVLQRVGRLRRHPRDTNGARSSLEQRGSCDIHLLSPEWAAQPKSDWLSSSDVPLSEIVYQDPTLLWHTQRTLLEAGHIHLPGNARALVESVYSEEARARVPTGLAAGRRRAEQTRKQLETYAGCNALKFARGYAQDQNRWAPEEDTPTRISEETVIVRVAKHGQGAVPSPWIADEDLTLAWALSELKVRASLIDAADGETNVDATGVGGAVTLPFSDIGGMWTARASSRKGPRTVHYSPVRGLEVSVFEASQEG